MLRSHGWACPELSRPRSTTGVGTTAISRWRTSGTAVRQARRPLRLLRHHREYRATRPALPAGRKVVAQAAGPTNAPACPILGQLQRDPRTPPTAPPSDRPLLRRAQPSSPVKNRMREICTSGTVGARAATSSPTRPRADCAALIAPCASPHGALQLHPHRTEHLNECASQRHVDLRQAHHAAELEKAWCTLSRFFVDARHAVVEMAKFGINIEDN